MGPALLRGGLRDLDHDRPGLWGDRGELVPAHEPRAVRFDGPVLVQFRLRLSKRLLSLFLPPYQLPVLDRLARQPKVAVIYATMNDVVPACVRAIRQAYPCDVYILDDSSDAAKRAIVDRLAVEMGFRLLRRPNREAFKAGAINNWLRADGSEYDYLVLLDADSALPPDWVGRSEERRVGKARGG